MCVGKFVYDYVKKPFATKIYNIPLWKYGFSTATIIRDSSKASSYITKYITKDLSHILQNQHRYLASQNIDKPLERVFNIDYDELSRIYSKYLSHITYMSDVKLPGAGQEILYMELQKGKGNPAPCKTNFSIFEPELKKPKGNQAFLCSCIRKEVSTAVKGTKSLFKGASRSKKRIPRYQHRLFNITDQKKNHV